MGVVTTQHDNRLNLVILACPTNNNVKIVNQTLVIFACQPNTHMPTKHGTQLYNTHI